MDTSLGSSGVLRSSRGRGELSDHPFLSERLIVYDVFMKYLAILSVMFFVVGCGPETKQYKVALKNDTPQPLLIGLAKSDGPFEELWASPEELAISDAQGAQRLWGRVVPPGKSASTPIVSGKFYPGDGGWLRIYAGIGKRSVDFSGLLAISRGDPNRLDIRLQPGYNAFIIRDTDGNLTAIRVDHPANLTKP